MRGALRAAALAAAGALAAAAGARAGAQELAAAERPRDPYTNNDPESMRRAGYVSFGPFPWGDGHGTRDIEKALGNIQILWVETAHFKIGSNLSACTPADKRERDKLRRELEALRAVLPAVDPEQRKLDPWLRLHLFARRLEDLYADFCRRLGVTDADFPSQPRTLVGGQYRGEGPYLGQPAKYTVLLLNKASAFARYFGRFAGAGLERPMRHNFVQTGTLFFGTSEELAEGSLKNDTAMHCHVVFGVVHNLVDGYCYYSVELPIWWKEGLAHWFARRVDPHHNNFTTIQEEGGDPRTTWNWPPKVRGRVEHDYFPGAADLLGWFDYDERRFADHMMMWSRVDYLMSLGDEGFRTFMTVLKSPFPPPAPPAREAVLARQAEALRRAFGLDPATFDARWRAFVLDTYPEK